MNAAWIVIYIVSMLIVFFYMCGTREIRLEFFIAPYHFYDYTRNVVI